MQAKVRILGSGGSMGVPVIGCDCPICTSSSAFNKRLRPSLVIEVEDKTILIDCGPDFRAQALAAGLKKIDMLLLTHTHFDHIAGLDDLRIFCLRKKGAIPCYLSEHSYEDIQKRYYYLFEKTDESVVRLDCHVLEEPQGSFDLFRYFTYSQNGMVVLGFRLGNFAYLTDIKQYDDSLFDELQGVEYLILSMQQRKFSHAHLNLDDIIAFHERVNPRHSYITHMGHDIDYHELKTALPAGMEPSYDGLTFWIEL